MNDLDQETRPPTEAAGSEPSARPRRRRRATGGRPTEHPGELPPPERPPTEPPPGASLRRSSAAVGADLRAEQGRVEFGAIARAEANEIAVDKGAVGLVARADAVSLRMGLLGAAFARNVRLRQGFARTVVALEATVEQGGVRALVANRVTLGPQSLAGIVVARSVEGPGRAILDWRGALVFAAAIVLLRLLGRRSRAGRTAGA